MKVSENVPEFARVSGTVVTTIHRNVLAFTSDADRLQSRKRGKHWTPSPKKGMDTGMTGAVGPVSVNSPAERVMEMLKRYRHEVEVNADC